MTKRTETVHGIVEAFNISPKGSPEGVLLKAGQKRIQINFPKEFSAQQAQQFRSGEAVDVEAEPEDTHGHPAHAVYRFVSFAGEAAKDFRFTGVVKRLNYALHGEVNGAILESGEFLHLKPHGAAALQLKVAMKVQGSGVRKSAAGENQVIEAAEVNGISIDKKPKPKQR